MSLRADPMTARNDLVASRLREVRAYFGLNQDEMANRSRLGTRGWQRLEQEGRTPKDEALALLAEGGIDLNWLLTGAGQMLRGAPSKPPAQPTAEVDARFYGAVLEGVSAIYAECGVTASLAQIGAEAAEMAADLAAIDPDQRGGAILGAISQLRRRLLASNDRRDDPTHGKQSA